MSRNENPAQLYKDWVPGKVANTEQTWAMTFNLLKRLEKGKGSEITDDLIKADAMVSEGARALGGRNKVFNVARDQFNFIKDEINKLPEGSRQAAQRLFKQFQAPSRWDQFMEFRTASLLTGPPTLARNAIGNTIGRAFRFPEKTLAGGINLIESKIRGIPQQRFAREGIADLIGMRHAFRPAMNNAIKGLLDEDFISDSRVMESVRFKKAIPGLAGKIIRLPFRLLGATDEFYRTLSHSASLYSQATRQALREKSKDIPTRVAQLLKKQTPEMIIKASNESKIDTFRQPGGPFSQAIENVLRKSKIGKFIVPFFQTPVNLFKWSYRRGPTSVLSKENWKLIAKGSPEERAEGIARMALGQMITVGLAMEAFDGNITARLSPDKGKRDSLQRQGIQPYSIKAGDKYISYRSYEPISSMLSLVANLAEQSREGKKLKPEDYVQISMETLKMMKDQTFLRGVSDVVNALEDPERFGPRFAQNATTSLIPAGIGYIARLEDPIIREPESIPQAIRAKLPGFSKGVPPKLDVWGRPITREGTLSQRALLPSSVTTIKPDLTEEELMSLDLFPKKINKTYRGLKLTNFERNSITQVEGQIAKQLLDRAVASKEYQAMNPTAQDEFLSQIVSKTRSAVRQPFFKVKVMSEFRKLKTNEEKLEFIEKVSRKILIKR
jgi:hypothetical protein